MNRPVKIIILLFLFKQINGQVKENVNNQLKIINKTEDYTISIENDPGKKMTDLKKNIPGLMLDLRYATPSNFTSEVLYPPLKTTYLRKDAAIALSKVQKALNEKGFGIKIWDAYRPYAVTVKMWELIHDERYVADPKKGSGHNRGIAVDLTLINLKTGKELHMPTGFDNFSDTAHPDFSNLSADVIANRKLLRSTMERYGFKQLETEWWHYYLPDVNKYEVLNLSFDQLKNLESNAKDYHSKERSFTITDYPKGVIIHINAPAEKFLQKNKRTYLLFYALPNGNSIEWTMGKQMQPGDDWHYDIQHIAAQTRYIRHLDSNNNYVVIYLAAKQKSWPLWKRTYSDYPKLIQEVIDTVKNMYRSYPTSIILSSHSGGGSFIFGYLDGINKIPDEVERIAFIDSDYGYNDSAYSDKLIQWLKSSGKHYLNVLAYNDSVVFYNGKPLVSPTGGTWYRTKLMQKKLAETFAFKYSADTSLIRYSALNRRIRIILKENPNGLIYHTRQVEWNGFIFSTLSGTRFDKLVSPFYFKERVYNDYIATEADSAG